jgi:hypothetical protein
MAEDGNQVNGDDDAELSRAEELGRLARAEMSMGRDLAVPRKRELRRLIRKGDEATAELRRRHHGQGEGG